MRNSRSLSSSGVQIQAQRNRTRTPLPHGSRGASGDSRAEPIVVDNEVPVVEIPDAGTAEPYTEPPPSRPQSPPRVPSSPSGSAALSVNSSRSRASTSASTRYRLAQSEAETQALRAQLDALRARGTPTRLEAVEEHGISGPVPTSSASGAAPRDPWIEPQPLATLRDAVPVAGAPVVLPTSDGAISYDAMRARRRIAAGQPPANLWTAPGTVIQLNQTTEVSSNASLAVAHVQSVEQHSSAAVLAAQTRLSLIASEANAHVNRAAQGENHARDVVEYAIAEANQRISATENAANEYAAACAFEHRARTEATEHHQAEGYARAGARMHGQLLELEQRLSQVKLDRRCVEREAARSHELQQQLAE